MAGFIGSSGTLVSTVLETLGSHYQSFLLDSAGLVWFNSLGALCYLIGMLASLILYFGSGQIKWAGWLLIGPGLYFSVISFRTPTVGSEWTFGDNKRDQTQVESVIEISLESNTGDARVLSLFAYYNRFISSLVQESVAFLMKSKDKLDTKFIVREQMYAIISSPSVESQGFRELLHAGLVTNCAPFLEMGRKLISPSTPYPEICGTNSKKPLYEQYMEMANIPHVLTPNAQKYVKRMLMDSPELMDDLNITKVDKSCVPDVARTRCKEASAVSVPADQHGKEQLWEGFQQVERCFQGKEGGITDYINRLCQKAKDNVARKAEVAGTKDVVDYGEANRDLDLERKAIEFSNRGFYCHDIWNMVFAGLHREALSVYGSGLNKLGDLKVVSDEEMSDLCAVGKVEGSITKDFAAFSGSDEQGHILRFIAKNLFREEMNSSSAAAVSARLANRGEIYHNIGVPDMDKLEGNERQATHRREWEQRLNLMVTAANLPYAQGLLLYWLSVVFPLFALLLLIPGKHSGFFLWFGFWAWAKSWDIGYAVVYLLDDVLHTMFVVENSANPLMSQKALSPDIAVAIETLRQLDPVFQLATYYNIMAVALMAIPTVTGYVFLNGFNGGVGLLTQGVARTASGTFAASIGGVADQASYAQNAPNYISLTRFNTDMEAIAARANIAQEGMTKPGLAKQYPGSFLTPLTEQYRRSTNVRSDGGTPGIIPGGIVPGGGDNPVSSAINSLGEKATGAQGTKDMADSYGFWTVAASAFSGALGHTPEANESGHERQSLRAREHNNQLPPDKQGPGALLTAARTVGEVGYSITNSMSAIADQQIELRNRRDFLAAEWGQTDYINSEMGKHYAMLITQAKGFPLPHAKPPPLLNEGVMRIQEQTTIMAGEVGTLKMTEDLLNKSASGAQTLKDYKRTRKVTVP